MNRIFTELATMLHERISGIKFTMDFSPIMRSAVACCVYSLFQFIMNKVI